MRRHLKIQEMPTNWPVPRKGATFILRKNSKGIPILVVLRDVLKIARTRKEVKISIHKKDLLACGKPVNDEKKSLELFDIFTIVSGDKNYRINLNEKGKFSIEEISKKDANTKVAKIIGKKTKQNKKVQLNLSDGRNYFSDLKCQVNDSVVINFEKNKVESILPLKEKAKILVVGGKHTGMTGTIEKIIPELKMVEISSGQNKVNILIKQLMVTQ